MSKVIVPLGKEFEEMEAVTIIDVLRRGGIEVIVASLDSQLAVKGANRITIMADRSIEGISADDIDMIVLPGGWGGTYQLADSDLVQNLLKEMDDKEKLIGAICAAPFALKRHDILPKNYTCYPKANEFVKGFNYIDSKQVVEDGNVMTSRGPATAICFGLQIVKKLVGEDVYKDVRAGLLAEYCD